MGVEYIRGNPAIGAFQSTMKSLNDDRQADITAARDKQKLEEDTAISRFKVARAQADSRLATTAADVAEANKGADIKIRYQTADRGDLENQGLSVDLGEKRATSPSRVSANIASNEATRDQAPISTQRASLEQSERAQTSPMRVQQERNRTTISGQQAQDSQLKFIKDVVTLLDQGKTAEAEELARRSGETIPDSVKNDSALRRTLKQATEDAERYYPNRPAAQQRHVRTVMDELAKRGPANATTTSPRLDALPGLPSASETGTPKSPTALQQNIPYLITAGIAKDEKDAFRLLNQSKNDYQGTIKELYRDEYKRRTEAAKGPGGFTAIDNKKLNEIDNQAMEAAVANAKKLRGIANELGPIQTPAATSLAAGDTAAAQETQPGPSTATAPAKEEAKAQEKPSWWQGWWNGKNAAKQKASGDAPSIRDYQTPPKQQDRAPGGAPAAGATTTTVQPLTAEEIQRRAAGRTPQQIREDARAAIASGRDRNGVLQRLRELGVDTSGL